MFKKLLTSMMALAVFVLAGYGSASAEYTHVFHRVNTIADNDYYDIYIDFEGIQESKEETHEGTWTRYMVPVKTVFPPDGHTSSQKYFFVCVDTRPNSWDAHRTYKGDEGSWYDIENWDNVKVDDIYAIEKEGLETGQRTPIVYSGSPDLSKWNMHNLNTNDYETDPYNWGNVHANILKKVIQYKAGIITGREAVSQT